MDTANVTQKLILLIITYTNMDIFSGHQLLGPRRAQSVQQWATGCKAGAQFPTEARYLSLFHILQVSSSGCSGSCPASTEGSFPGIKHPGSEADLSSPFFAEIKTGGAILPLPLGEWKYNSTSLHGLMLN
jgi:hypothetical protein